MKRVIGTVVAAALIAVCVAIPAPASAAPSKTWVVGPSESVQSAINKAKPGDRIVLLPGVYRQSVTITKNGITLRGAGSASGGTVFKAPSKLPNSPCRQASGGAGVCVLGKINDQFEVTKRVSDVTVSGIRFVDWPSMGVFAFGAKDLRLLENTVIDAGEYGLARFDSLGGVVQNNTVIGGGEAGIYVGDSADADTKVINNDVSGSLFGIFIRHASGVTVQLNHAWNNCQGIMVLDDGSPGGVSDITLRYNYVTLNNAACPGSDEEPPLSGGGILLLGASDSTVAWNTVRGNEGTEINSGGIVVMTAADIVPGASDPMNNVVSNNTAFGNSPADVSYDGTGTGNVLTGNFCETSSPGGFCV